VWLVFIGGGGEGITNTFETDKRVLILAKATTILVAQKLDRI
jgi:hypothetical protein